MIVDIHSLSRRFGSRLALDQINLQVPAGSVLGLVGVNGSGKTTLLKHILGLYAAQTGQVRVFGLDPVADPVGVLSRAGFLSEQCDLPNWMRLGEYLRYCASFRPKWDQSYALALCQRWGLDTTMRLNAFSRGLRMRAGLVSVLAYRPELLVLDEPSSGLDPLARRDILEMVIRSVSSEGATVLFSSHLLDEVERVADRVALLDAGKLLFTGELDEIRGQHRRLTLRFAQPRSTPPELAGVLRWEGQGQEWTAVCHGAIDVLEASLTKSGGDIVDRAIPRLEELLAAHATKGG
jgi:ABC-2 type transport system ATP-binding protein